MSATTLGPNEDYDAGMSATISGERREESARHPEAEREDDDTMERTY